MDNWMLVVDMRDAKRLSSMTWDSLLPSERQRVLSLLGVYYHAYDRLATELAFANGRVEQLRESLGFTNDAAGEHKP